MSHSFPTRRSSDLAEALRTSIERTQQERDAAQRAAAQADTAKRQRAADQQRAANEARQREMEESARRELAWTRFYRKPPGCDEARGGAWTVDCANDYIRAKKRFAEQYDAGKL